MSERIDLRSGQEIRDWISKNGVDIVNLDSDAPRFLQPKFMPSPGPMLLFAVEHTYLTTEEKAMVSLRRAFRATSAEDALQQYLREPKERSFGRGDQMVGFTLHDKPGRGDREALTVVKVLGE
jgi:hypothetical protein